MIQGSPEYREYQKVYQRYYRTNLSEKAQLFYKEWRAEYYQRNKEKILARNKAYWQKNKEKINHKRKVKNYEKAKQKEQEDANNSMQL